MPLYRERLWAAPWLYVAAALVIPASLLVFAPISIVAGIVTAVLLYGGCVAGLIWAGPVIEVTDAELRAGKAHIALSLLGEAEAYSGRAAWEQRGPSLDVRAYLLLRGWADGVVRVPVTDPADPAPYWLVSSRQPKRMAAAINGSRRPVAFEE